MAREARLSLILAALALVAATPSRGPQDDEKQERPCSWSKRWEDETAAKPVRCCPEGPVEQLEHSLPDFPETDVGHWPDPILLEFVIEPDGTVDEVHFARRPLFKPPWPEAEEAIVEAVRKWRYEPVVLDGEGIPICSIAAISINWS